MGTTIMTVYHGTDQSVAQDILRQGFRCKENKEHWLGEGIYFYIDKSLAEWWTTNPTTKHGMAINNPAIIECTIEVDEDKVLDLRTLKGYEKYVDLYNSFFRKWAYHSKPNEEVKINVIRAQSGAITESDVLLASASNAIIIGFNIRPNNSIKDYAKESGSVGIQPEHIILGILTQII